MDLTKPVMIQGYGVNLFVVEQVERMLARGDLTPDRKFFQQGMEAWLPLWELAALLGKPGAKSRISTEPASSLENLPGNAALKPDPSASSFRRVASIRLAKGTLRFRTDIGKLE